MNRLNALLGFAILAGWYSATANGQECPSSIEVTETVGSMQGDWEERASKSERLLSGIDVIEGAIHENPSDDARLAPQSLANGESVWKFRGVVGTSVVWMVCTYRDTRVRLVRRVDPSVTECKVKKTASSNSVGKSKVKAFCGVTSKENK